MEIKVLIDAENPPHFTIMEDFQFEEYFIPKGFQTDFSTIPGIVRLVYKKVDNACVAALIHDLFYEMRDIPRSKADLIFRDIMIRTNCGLFKSYLYWISVRLFGWIIWYKKIIIRFLRAKQIIKHPESKYI